MSAKADEDQEVLTIGEAPGAPLSDAVQLLIAEARQEGFDWMANLEGAWVEGPFIGPGEALFLAWVGDRLVGVAAITEDHYLRDGQTGRLRFVYVSPTSRGCGIADALTTHCLARAAGRWAVIRLHTDNPVAARLYAKFGFALLADADGEATHATASLG